VRGFVFDAGAFIALERSSPLLLGILDEALHGTVEVVLPRTVIAQIWRGTPRQANVGRLISAGRARGGPVIIDELTAERARQIGITVGTTSHRDIVDVHVALAAAERGHAVLTCDDADIARVNPGLVLVHV
jgi:predicted nucleic acid-binding protein